MWVKLDDNVLEHPKMIAIGIRGRALWLAGLCYANKQATDGYIPDYMIKGLADRAGVAEIEATLTKLTTVYKPMKNPLWHRVEGGYQIHDYAEYQPTAEEVEELRVKRHLAAKKASNARWHASTDAEGMRERMRQRMPNRMRFACPVHESRSNINLSLKEEYVVDDAWYEERRLEKETQAGGYLTPRPLFGPPTPNNGDVRGEKTAYPKTG